MVLGFQWRIEADANGLIKMAEVSRAKSSFGSRVGQVQLRPNLDHGQLLRGYLMMNEVDGNGDVPRTSSDCVGLKDVDARLDVLVDWRGIDVLVGEAEEFSDGL